MGRFTASDPARQGLNWYAYCSNSPLCYIDPDGQFIMSAIGAGALWLSQYLVNIWNSLYLAGIDAMAVISSPAFPLLVEAASTPAEPTRSDTGGPTGGNGNGGRPPFMPDLGSVPLAEVVRQAMDRIAKNDEMQKHIMYGSKRAAGSLEHSWEKLVGNAPTWEQVAKVSAGLHANVSAAIGVINGLEVEIRVFCNTPGVWLVNDAWVRF